MKRNHPKVSKNEQQTFKGFKKNPSAMFQNLARFMRRAGIRPELHILLWFQRLILLFVNRVALPRPTAYPQECLWACQHQSP